MQKRFNVPLAARLGYEGASNGCSSRLQEPRHYRLGAYHHRGVVSSDSNNNRINKTATTPNDDRI